MKCPRGDPCLPVSACLSHCLQCNELGQTVSTFIDCKPLLRAVDSRAIKVTLEGVMAVIKWWLDLGNLKIKNRGLQRKYDWLIMIKCLHYYKQECAIFQIKYWNADRKYNISSSIRSCYYLNKSIWTEQNGNDYGCQQEYWKMFYVQDFQSI